MSASSITPAKSSSIGRSILAVLAGIAIGVILSVGSDWLLRTLGIAPSQSQRWPNQILLLAATYRSIYGVIAAYVIARLAPNRPMRHAMVAGVLGTIVSALGAIAMWSTTAGQHWYALSLVVTAIPTAWLGAKLRLMQHKTEIAAA